LEIAEFQTYVSPHYDLSRYVMENSIKNTKKDKIEEIISPYPMVNSLDKFGIKKFYPTKENGLKWFDDWDEDRTVHRNSFDGHDHKFGLANGNGLIIGDGKASIRAFNTSHRLFVKGPWLNTNRQYTLE